MWLFTSEKMVAPLLFHTEILTRLIVNRDELSALGQSFFIVIPSVLVRIQVAPCSVLSSVLR